MFAASSAQGSVLGWNNPAGGSASVPANWSPSQLPVTADDLTFALGGTFAITFNSSVLTTRTHTYRAGTLTLTMSSPHTVTNGMVVGSLSGDNATVTVTTGALTSDGAVAVASAAGSIGRINVNDDDADLNIGNNADLTVGVGGNGTLSITGTGHVEVADQFILGANATSVSTATISGFSVAPIGVSLLQTLSTAQSRIGAGGDASMLIEMGGVAHFGGDLVIANGSASTSSVTVQNSGLLPARLTVDSDLLIGRNTSASVAAGNGTLNLNTGGAATVVGDTLVGDPDGGFGLVHMSGGTLDCDGLIQVTPGSRIDGAGTINADIDNVGDIEPTGVGLTINGILSNDTSNQIVGTKLHFGPNGGYEGSGTCQAEVSGDIDSTITATGTLTIGANSTAGFFYLGHLDVGGNIVTLNDFNGAVLGGLTTINSGRIECPAGVGIQNGARLQGDGLFVGTVTNSGIIDPAHAVNPTNGGGLITVQGNLHMNPTGVFDMHINSDPSNATSYDRMVVSGTATFGGTLRLHIRPGFIPNWGNQFIAINALQGRVGEFDSIDVQGPLPCNGVNFALVYSTTAAIVIVRPTDADINADNVVNIDDLVWVITHWNDPGPGPNGVSPVDIDDLVLVITKWGCQGT